MRVLTISASVLLLGLGVSVGACSSKKSNSPSPSSVAQMGDSSDGAAANSGKAEGAGQGGAAAISGGAAAGTHSAGTDAAGSGAAGAAMVCDKNAKPTGLGIASVKLNTPPPIKLAETVQLMGDGLNLTLMPQQNVTAGLRWRGDRMFLTADQGFWDIGADGTATWKMANAVVVWGIRSADLDGDGDQDLLVLTMQLNTMPPAAGAPPAPFVSKLAAWERTPTGLMERAEVMSTPEGRIGMPYAVGDIDKDGDLDVIGYDKTPVAYVNDGAFKFTPSMLAAEAPELAGKGAIMLDLADRNGDGSPDLLMVAGNTMSAQAENSILVMLGDGTGKLKAPGMLTPGRTPLVPYGPDGSGVGIADVTGDGIADVLMQSAESGEMDPVLRVYMSTDATTVAAPMELKALGFEFADVDKDGKTDIVTTVKGRLSALLSRGGGMFETRDLGVSIAPPQVKDFVVEPGEGTAQATVHVLYNLETCPACDAGCTGHCLFGTCVECLSDGDCTTGTCQAQACAP